MSTKKPKVVLNSITAPKKGLIKPQVPAAPTIPAKTLNIQKITICNLPSNSAQEKSTSCIERDKNIPSKFDSMELVVAPDSLGPQLTCPNCQASLSMRNKQEQVQETRLSRQMADTHSLTRRVQSLQPSLKA